MLAGESLAVQGIDANGYKVVNSVKTGQSALQKLQRFDRCGTYSRVQKTRRY